MMKPLAAYFSRRQRATTTTSMVNTRARPNADRYEGQPVNTARSSIPPHPSSPNSGLEATLRRADEKAIQTLAQKSDYQSSRRIADKVRSDPTLAVFAMEATTRGCSGAKCEDILNIAQIAQAAGIHKTPAGVPLNEFIIRCYAQTGEANTDSYVMDLVSDTPMLAPCAMAAMRDSVYKRNQSCCIGKLYDIALRHGVSKTSTGESLGAFAIRCHAQSGDADSYRYILDLVKTTPGLGATAAQAIASGRAPNDKPYYQARVAELADLGEPRRAEFRAAVGSTKPPTLIDAIGNFLKSTDPPVCQ